MRMVRGVSLCVAWTLVACVAECEEQPTRIVGRVATPATSSPARPEPEGPARPAHAEPASDEPEGPLHRGPVIAAEAFAPFAPDRLEAYVAQAPAERIAMPIPGAHEVSALKRTYQKDGSTLHLEMIDALYTPTPRQLVTQSQGSERTMNEVRYDGRTIAGHPGLLQWNQAQHMAKASVVLSDRYLVNIQVEPAEDPDEALRLIEGMPLDRIAALQPSAP